jgi:hypothetical protein
MARLTLAWASSFALVTSLASPALAEEAAPRVGSLTVPGDSGRLLAAVVAALSRPPPAGAPRMPDWSPPPPGLPRMTLATLCKITF